MPEVLVLKRWLQVQEGGGCNNSLDGGLLGSVCGCGCYGGGGSCGVSGGG